MAFFPALIFFNIVFKGLKFICAFILNFMSEEMAFWMLDILFNNLLPNEYINIQELFEKECDYIAKIGYAEKMFADIDSELLKIFLKKYIPILLESLFVDILNFQTTYHIWDCFLSKGNVNI